MRAQVPCILPTFLGQGHAGPMGDLLCPIGRPPDREIAREDSDQDEDVVRELSSMEVYRPCVVWRGWQEMRTASATFYKPRKSAEVGV